ncbi:MAG: hypothetical protein ACK4ZY_16190, partial [Sphingomonas sp.]
GEGDATRSVITTKQIKSAPLAGATSTTIFVKDDVKRRADKECAEGKKRDCAFPLPRQQTVSHTDPSGHDYRPGDHL